MDDGVREAVQELYRDASVELEAYLCKLVVRPEVAEEIAQAAFLKAMEHGRELPSDASGRRAWLFRVATNLALDALRRHSTWRETTLGDLREAGEADPAFVARSVELSGTPETCAIAREHLAACFSCTLRNLPEHKAAALLLKEVYGFSLEETAQILEATSGQAKSWLQEARAWMSAHYGRTCSLVAKDGVCHQCIELDGFFRAGRGSPLAGGELAERLEVVASLRQQSWGRWHRMLFALLDDLP